MKLTTKQKNDLSKFLFNLDVGIFIVAILGQLLPGKGMNWPLFILSWVGFGIILFFAIYLSK